MKYLEVHEIDTNQVFDEDEKAEGVRRRQQCGYTGIDEDKC